MNRIIYRCPKCGGNQFAATANVTQDWKLDQFGVFSCCLQQFIETTHYPDEEDVWDCVSCGNSMLGREFRMKEKIKNWWCPIGHDLTKIIMSISLPLKACYKSIKKEECPSWTFLFFHASSDDTISNV